jgi:hypothetical protein
VIHPSDIHSHRYIPKEEGVTNQRVYLANPSLFIYWSLTRYLNLEDLTPNAMVFMVS